MMPLLLMIIFMYMLQILYSIMDIEKFRSKKEFFKFTFIPFYWIIFGFKNYVIHWKNCWRDLDN